MKDIKQVSMSDDVLTYCAKMSNDILFAEIMVKSVGHRLVCPDTLTVQILYEFLNYAQIISTQVIIFLTEKCFLFRIFRGFCGASSYLIDSQERR